MRQNVSSAVFARCLNVMKSLVNKGESGETRRRSASLKFLTLVVKNGLDTIPVSSAGLARRRGATETVTGGGTVPSCGDGGEEETGPS